MLVKFTYVGKETRAITKILKNTNVIVTFGTDNTIEKLLTRHEQIRSKYEKSEIYQLTLRHMEHEVHRSNRKTVQRPVPGALLGLQIR